MGNVHVMAGVPRIMQAMFEALAPTLRAPAHRLGRGARQRADGRADRRRPRRHQARYPDRYRLTYYRAGGGGVAVVAKGIEPTTVKQAAHDVLVFMRACGGQPIEGEPG